MLTITFILPGIPSVGEDHTLTNYIYSYIKNMGIIPQLTDAHPHPDFFAGLTSFLQNIAQVLGEPNICPVSFDFILPFGSKSAVNF